MPKLSLPERPSVDPKILDRVRRDYERLAQGDWPPSIEAYLLEQYDLDVAAEYGGMPIKNPWGKASGQLSMTAAQVAEDMAAGLGFVVLKTLIAEDSAGEQAMRDWAIREAKMLVEPIVGRSGEPGWTVTWKGRGWWLPLDDYLDLIRAARGAAAERGALIVPSCKFHLPARADEPWKIDEYRHTMDRLLGAWQSAGASDERMPIEKDFSPTLAGSDRAARRERVLDWLRTVPLLIRGACPSRSEPIVGLKLFNALDDDDFQTTMLDAIHESADRPDYFVYGNRLFDPARTFEGHTGVAYGGPDLSDRNLRVMRQFAVTGRPHPLPWSATGNIVTGKLAVEYALCGASSFQVHTFFQLPATAYRRQRGSRAERALHELYFHPDHGLIVWLWHCAGLLSVDRQPLRFLDIVKAARRE